MPNEVKQQQQAPGLQKLYRPRYVAGVLGFDPSTIRRWIAEGRLRAVRVGPKSIRIPEAAVAELISERKRTQ